MTPADRLTITLRLESALARLLDRCPACLCGSCALCRGREELDCNRGRPTPLYKALVAIRAGMSERGCICGKCVHCRAAHAIQGWRRLVKCRPLELVRRPLQPGMACRRGHIITPDTLRRGLCMLCRRIAERGRIRDRVVHPPRDLSLCLYGLHPRTPENTLPRGQCRECKRISRRAWMVRNRERVNATRRALMARKKAAGARA